MELLDEDDLLELLRMQFLAHPTRTDIVLRACQKVVESERVQVPRDRFWMMLGLKFFPDNETVIKLEETLTNVDSPSVKSVENDENEKLFEDLSKRIRDLSVTQDAMEQLVKQNEEIIAELREQRREFFAATYRVDDGDEDIRGAFDELRFDIRSLGLERKKRFSEVLSGLEERPVALDCPGAQEETGLDQKQIDSDEIKTRDGGLEAFSVLFSKCQMNLGPNLENILSTDAVYEIAPLTEYNYAEGPVGPLRRARRRSTHF